MSQLFAAVYEIHSAALGRPSLRLNLVVNRETESVVGTAVLETHPQNRRMNIGAAIRKVRLEKGLTLEAVALEAGTYAGNLSKIERSQQLPSLELLHKLSYALGTKTSELYAVAESELEGGEEAASDQSNEVILVRRNFQALTPKNRRLAIEFLKLLGQSQDEA